MSDRVNVHLALREQLAIRTPKGEMVVTGVSFWVDDLREVVVRLRRQVDPQARR